MSVTRRVSESLVCVCDHHQSEDIDDICRLVRQMLVVCVCFNYHLSPLALYFPQIDGSSGRQQLPQDCSEEEK